MFLKNKNIIFKIRRSQVTDNAALNKAIGIINFAKPFSKFYRRYYDIISKFQVGL